MKKILLNAFLLMLAVSVTAASANVEEKEKKQPKERVVLNGFGANWFLTFNGGAVYYFGDNNNTSGQLSEKISPSFDVAVGKWVTPVVGLNVRYNFSKLRGYTASNDFFGEGLHTLTGEVMLNLTNGFCGYKPGRVYNAIPYLGFGFSNITRKVNDKLSTNYEYVASIGFLNTFTVHKRIDINLDLRYYLHHTRMDRIPGNNRFDHMTNISAGLTVRLGKTDWAACTSVDKDDVKKAEELMKKLGAEKKAKSALNDELAALKADNAKLRAVPVVAPIISETIKVKASPVALFFELDSHVLSAKELVNLEFFVKTAINIDTEKVFTIVGSADKETGTTEHNAKLSERRVEFVYNLLVNKYGIAPERLIKKPEGSTNNRFGIPELNRVVILE